MTQTDHTITDFDSIDKLLNEQEIIIDAAECHGILCGLLCSKGHFSDLLWTNQLWDDEYKEYENTLSVEAQKALKELHEITFQQLNDTQCTFYPLLPEDETPLHYRTEMLSSWCRGYLYGLGTGINKPLNQLQNDTAEAIQDLVDISQALHHAANNSDEDEGAYNEIVEYVRTVVMLLNEELQPFKTPPQIH